MNITTFLAYKFLSSKDRSFLVSFLTWMAVLGVITSVASFIVVEAVMAGFSSDLRGKIMGFSSHLTLTLQPETEASQKLLQEIQKNNSVKQVTHYLEGEVILRTEEDDTQGVELRGLDPNFLPPTQNLQISFEEGEDWNSLKDNERDLPGIILGAELASSLGVIPALLEKVELLYPFGEVGPTGEVEPNQRAFRVIGTFKSGYFDYDSKYGMVDIEQAKRLFGGHQQEQVGVFLKRPEATSRLQAVFQKFSGIEKIKSWQELHARLFSALQLERVGMAIVLVLMILLASFNILSMLTMVVFERRQEIAVLKSLGLSDTKIMNIFYRAGLWIGIVGSLLGALIGTALCYGLASAKIHLPSPYYIETLPIELNWQILLATSLLAPLVSFLATLFPAREGRDLSIVEALHYE